MKKKARGQFFTVQPSTWARACDLGMYEAVAYLVLAQGTGRNGKTTSWSADSLQKYAGIRWLRGKAAIERLIEHGLLRHGEKHKPKKPRYEFTSTAAEDPSTRIWLPNTLVTGTAEGEDSPVKRIRQHGDVWVLRTLVDLYSAHNLRDDGGIKPYLLVEKYERKLIGECGTYNLWAFKPGNYSANLLEALKSQKSRVKPPGGEHPFWASHTALQQTGLLTYVPHIWDNDPTKGADAPAEIVHPYGLLGNGAEDMEKQIARAAHAAAERVIIPAKAEAAIEDGFEYFCPVRASMG